MKEVTCKFGKQMNRYLLPTGMKYKHLLTSSRWNIKESMDYKIKKFENSVRYMSTGILKSELIQCMCLTFLFLCKH